MRKLLNTLYVTNPERYLSLDGENVVILEKSQEIGRVPLHNLEMIVTFGYAGASPALMGACASRGIGLVFLSGNGKFLAQVTGEVYGNVMLRKEQFRRSLDRAESLKIAKNCIGGKIYNSRWILERAARDYPMRLDVEKFHSKCHFLADALIRVQECENSAVLLGIEGEAASVYFSVFDDLILQQKASSANRCGQRVAFIYVYAAHLYVYTCIGDSGTGSVCRFFSYGQAGKEVPLIGYGRGIARSTGGSICADAH